VSGFLVVCLPLAQSSWAAAGQDIRPSDVLRAKREGKPLPTLPSQTGQDARSLRQAIEQTCRHYGDLALRQQRCYDLTLRAADAGDAEAMAELGWRSLEREGAPDSFQFQVRVVPHNDVAVGWIARSADEGKNRDGMTYLGWMFQRGLGVKRDPAQAQKWLRQAAEAGAPRAMALLGAMHLSGESTDGSEADGVRWLRRAVDAGDRRAMTLLALLHFKPSATAVQSATGDAPLALLNRACAGQDDWKATTTSNVEGDPLACYHLGLLYSTGSAGVARSRERAGVAFYNVSWLARNSDTFSRDWYEVGNGLTADVRRAAEQGRREFAPHLTGGSQPDSLWTALAGFTAILVAASIVGTALGIQPGSPSQRDEEAREERRRQRAQREAECIMLGGKWMSLAGVCHF
jgi:TPR repeat protein